MKSRDEIRAMISDSDAGAIRALVVLYAQQTPEEQRSGEHGPSNGRGFSPMHTAGMTRLAWRLEDGGKLERAEVDYLRRALPQYAGQIRRVMAERELDRLDAEINDVLAEIKASRGMREKKRLNERLGGLFAEFDRLQTIAIKG
jgi:hypothetical protein